MKLIFEELEFFLNKIQSQLKDLDIRDHTADLDYMDARRWEDYLDENFPRLQRFSLENYIVFNDNGDFPFEAFQSNQFTSSFWIKRQLSLDILAYDNFFVQQVRQYR